MVAREGPVSCAQHQCFNDYLQLLVFTGYEFTVNTDKCSTVCAPIDMIDQLGGWSLQSVGQGYRDGYDLKLLYKVMVSFSSRFDLMFLR